MSQTGIEVRKHMTVAVLRKKARWEKDGHITSRILGIANILDGMDRQTLCDSGHRYNEEGLAGLRNRPRLGKQPQTSDRGRTHGKPRSHNRRSCVCVAARSGQIPRARAVNGDA